MTKPNKTILISFRLTEDDLANLEYLRRRDETRSAAIRRIIYDAWYEAAKAQDAEPVTPALAIAGTVYERKN